MEPTPRPICWSCWLLIWLAEWRAVTCPISWADDPGELGLGIQGRHDFPWL